MAVIKLTIEDKVDESEGSFIDFKGILPKDMLTQIFNEPNFHDDLERALKRTIASHLSDVITTLTDDEPKGERPPQLKL